MRPNEIDRIINPPILGLHPDNLRYRGPWPIEPGMIAYAWPQFPFSFPTPQQRDILAKLPKKLRRFILRRM